MKIREVPGYGEVEFPDSMTDEEINKAIANLAPKEQFEFEPAPPPKPPSEAAARSEKMLYGGIGAGVGAAGSAAAGVGQASMAGARKLGEAREQGRLAAQRAAGASQMPMSPTGAPPTMAPNVERILQGTTEEGATGRARMQGFNTATAQQAAAAKEAEQLVESLRQKGVVQQGARSVLAGVPGLTSTESGVLIPRSSPAQTIGPRGQQGQMVAPRPSPVKPSGLDQVSRLFESMMQSSPIRGLATVAKYAAPPLALGSAGMDIADIIQEERKPDPDRIRQILSGLGAAGAGMAAFPPTAPIGIPLAIMAPAAQYIREQQKRPQMPSEPGLTAPEAAQYVSP